MKLTQITVCFLFCSGAVLAQPAGPNSSTNVFDGGSGQITEVWTNPNLARTQNDLYASLVTTTKNKRTNYLQAQNFGFNLPAGSSINGIIVEIDRHETAAGGGAADARIEIIDATGAINAASDKSTGLAWPTSDANAYQSYGGITDTWGLTWTSAQINNANFGVAIQAATSNDNSVTFTLFVDHIRITVHYTVGGSQRYAVANGNWNSTASWALTPGGAPGAAVPTAADDVFIGGGFTILQNVNGADCNSLTIGTTEGNPTGILNVNNNNQDIDIGSSGLVITADGDIIGTNSPTLTTSGDFTLNKVLTNRDFIVRMQGTDGVIISGTGSLGRLNTQNSTTNTGTLTITEDLAGPDNRLINAATAFIIFSGSSTSAINLTTVGNTIEFSHTVADGNFNIRNASNSFYHLVISNDANKSYSGNITVNGDLTITATGILNNSSSNAITLIGNWTNNNGAAGFVPNNCNGCIVAFSGGNTQSVTNAAGEQFHRVTVDKTAGTTVSAANNIVLDNLLTMTEGIFDIGSRTLTGTANVTFNGGELKIGTTGVTVPQLSGTYTLNNGTITFDGAGAQTIRTTASTPAITSYVNVQFLGSGTKSLSGLMDVDGDLTIGGTATLDVVTASNFGITLAGDWSSTSTFLPQAGTVTLNGAATQTITNAAGETFHNLTINNSTASSAIVLGGPVFVNNTMTFTDGHIITTASNLLTLNASATAATPTDASHVDGPVGKVKNTTAAFAFPVGDGVNYQPVSVTPTTTANTTFVAEYFSIEQTQGAGLGAGIDHVSSQDYWTVQRPSGTADAAVTLSWEYAAAPEIDNIPELRVAQWDGTLWASQGNAATTGNANAGTITSNTVSSFTQPYFVIASSTTNNPLSINRYFVAVTGNWDGAGVWAYRSGGAATATAPSATKNVFIESGNTVTILDATEAQSNVSMLSLTIFGTITMANAAGGTNVDMAVGAGGLTLNAAANITGPDDDNITVGGDIVLNNSANLSATLLEVNFSSQGNTISGTGSLPYLRVNDNNQLFTGNVTFTTLDVPNTASNDGTITLTGALSGGGTLTNNATGTIIWQGTSIAGNLIDASTAGNTVHLTNNTGGNIDIDVAVKVNTFHHLILGGANQFIQTNNTIILGNLTILAGGIYNNGNNNRRINIGGNWTNNNGTGGFLQGTNDITFDGTSAQSISISSGNEAFNTLIINNTSATGVTLINGEVHITNDFQLLDGIVFTDATSLLVLEDNATSDVGSAASFVDGPMKKIGNEAFVFPVGDGSTWARLGMESIANYNLTTEFTCQYLYVAYSNTTSLDVDVTNVSGIEHWLLQRVTDPSNDASCNVRLFWESETVSEIDDLADLRVGHFYNSGSGDKWHNFGGTVTDNGNGSGEIVSTTLFTTFSPITFASEFGFNALPVELLSFTAKVKDQWVELQWKTASELDNAFFEIERFSPEQEIRSLGVVEGHGTTTRANTYQFTDQEPLDGRSYYRLKQVDFNGEYQYSNTITVTFQADLSRYMTIFPNPGNGTSLGISSRATGRVRITIYNLKGTMVESAITTADGHAKLDHQLQSTLSPGIYMVRLEHHGGVLTRKWIVK